MANIMHMCIISLAWTVSAEPESCLGRCGIALNTGSVGSCMMLPCSSSRGPTYCSMGSCYCKEGFCRYPATTLHVQSRTCRQRAGHDSCHTSRFCYNAGLTTTSCSSGLCFCSFNYVYDCAKKTCVKLSEGMALAGNMTQEEMQEFAELEREGRLEVMQNVAIAAMWGCAALGLLIASILVLRSRLRGAKVEDAQYAVLAE